MNILTDGELHQIRLAAEAQSQTAYEKGATDEREKNNNAAASLHTYLTWQAETLSRRARYTDNVGQAEYYAASRAYSEISKLILDLIH